MGTNNGKGGGIGQGFFLVYYNNLGNINQGSIIPGEVVGFRWSIATSEHFTQAQRHLVIGRLQ